MSSERCDTNNIAGLDVVETSSRSLSQKTNQADLPRHSRIDVQFSADIISENGEVAQGPITNISRSGLRLEGDRKMADTLFPNFNRRDKKLPLLLIVSFAPPLGTTVMISGGAVYIRRITHDTYQIGMEFTVFEEGDYALGIYLISKHTE